MTKIDSLAKSKLKYRTVVYSYIYKITCGKDKENMR